MNLIQRLCKELLSLIIPMETCDTSMLPTEIWIHILEYVGYGSKSDISNLLSVCKMFRDILLHRDMEGYLDRIYPCIDLCNPYDLGIKCRSIYLYKSTNIYQFVTLYNTIQLLSRTIDTQFIHVDTNYISMKTIQMIFDSMSLTLHCNTIISFQAKSIEYAQMFNPNITDVNQLISISLADYSQSPMGASIDL